VHIKSEDEVFRELSQVSVRLHGLVSTKEDSVYIGNSATSRSIVQKFIMDGNDSVIKRLALDACYRAEGSGPGSGDLVLSNLSVFTDHLLRVRRFNGSSWGEIVRNSRGIASRNFLIYSHKLSRKVFEEIVDEIKDPVRSLVVEAIEIGSPSSTFKVRRSNRVDSLCSRDDGYKFNVSSPLKEVTGKSQDWTRRNADVIVIDGIIESVSEIHHILERYSSSRQPLCIVCRNVSPEILTTLRYNNARGTLDVVICTFGYDELRANLLVDAAVCCGVDVVSTLQGDLINANISKIGVVDRITLSDSLFSLQNSRSSKSVSDHRKRLQKKHDESDPATAEIIEKRMASLINDVVNIDVGVDIIDRDPRAVEVIDQFLRSMNSYMRTGYILRSEMEKFLSDDESIQKLLSQSLKEVRWHLPEILPAASFLSFVRYTIQLSVDLIGIGLIVEKE
jgi:hypothetical protein